MSVIPALVAHWQSVEDIAVGLPLGHELIHQGHKARIVSWFEQVNHLVDDNIFKTFQWLSGEIGIQSNGAGAIIAATPFRLHPLDENSPHPYPYQPLPFFNQRRSSLHTFVREL
jgi:hypothetical protein